MDRPSVVPDLTLADIAELWRMDIRGVRRLAAQGKVPGAYRIGRKWRVNRQIFLRDRNKT